MIWIKTETWEEIPDDPNLLFPLVPRGCDLLDSTTGHLWVLLVVEAGQGVSVWGSGRSREQGEGRLILLPFLAAPAWRTFLSTTENCLAPSVYYKSDLEIELKILHLRLQPIFFLGGVIFTCARKKEIVFDCWCKNILKISKLITRIPATICMIGNNPKRTKLMDRGKWEDRSKWCWLYVIWLSEIIVCMLPPPAMWPCAAFLDPSASLQTQGTAQHHRSYTPGTDTPLSQPGVCGIGLSPSVMLTWFPLTFLVLHSPHC